MAVDHATFSRTAQKLRRHSPAEAAVVAGLARVEILGVRENPRSGKPAELMQAHGLSAQAIVATVRRLL